MDLEEFADDIMEKDTNSKTSGEVTDPTEVSVDPTIADPTIVSIKQRTPQIKLTAERLLSEKGLPYVIKNAPKMIRISKKRNTYDNLNNIVRFYQLWAHELYPKAKFKDFLALCQTLGRSDRYLREYRTNQLKEELGIPTANDFFDNPLENMDNEQNNDNNDTNTTIPAPVNSEIDKTPKLFVDQDTFQGSDDSEDDLYTVSKTQNKEFDNSKLDTEIEKHVTDKQVSQSNEIDDEIALLEAELLQEGDEKKNNQDQDDEIALLEAELLQQEDDIKNSQGSSKPVQIQNNSHESNSNNDELHDRQAMEDALREKELDDEIANLEAELL